MAFFRASWLALLTAMFFAIGHGHQVFGKLVAHDHGFAHHQHAGGGEHDHDAPLPQQDSHGAPTGSDHHALTAIAAVPAFSLICVSFPIVLATGAAQLAPDAPVFGIEHPPQLARA